jgi:starch synthase
MEKIKVLYVSQEITPYLPESPMSKMGRFLPQLMMERGKEIRTFMPRFGKINERRHQLHEVIRLSGMNLVVNDIDHPLIIKVASIQPARMQVYFIDNEEYFHRKAVLHDEKGKAFKDNDERAIFFVKGVIETVKKLGWSPDIIHMKGWMSGLLPLYLRTVYKDDPLFIDSKIVYSVYGDEPNGKLNKKMGDKIRFDIEDPKLVNDRYDYNEIHKSAIQFADAITIGDDEVSTEIRNFIESNGKLCIEVKESEEDEMIEKLNGLYENILDEKTVFSD